MQEITDCKTVGYFFVLHLLMIYINPLNIVNAISQIFVLFSPE